MLVTLQKLRRGEFVLQRVLNLTPFDFKTRRVAFPTPWKISKRQRLPKRVRFKVLRYREKWRRRRCFVLVLTRDVFLVSRTRSGRSIPLSPQTAPKKTKRKTSHAETHTGPDMESLNVARKTEGYELKSKIEEAETDVDMSESIGKCDIASNNLLLYAFKV